NAEDTILDSYDTSDPCNEKCITKSQVDKSGQATNICTRVRSLFEKLPANIINTQKKS
ncbi:6594_t:CDS:2, partial [Racocetra persica]